MTFDGSLFTGIVADRRFLAALAIAAVSGLVRGFSGFGSALIYVPLVAAVYEPRIAAVTLLLIDFSASSPFAIREARNCNWREVLPMFLGAAVAIPFGTIALVALDPIVLRWFIAFLVLLALAFLISGWRYRGRPRLPAAVGVGLFSGFGIGAVQIGGPAVIIYWLGTANKAVTARANLMVYFLLTDAVLCVAYVAEGLITSEAIALSVLLGIPFLATLAVGARIFHGASDLLYRRIAYVIIAVAALVSLPIFDKVLR